MAENPLPPAGWPPIDFPSPNFAPPGYSPPPVIPPLDGSFPPLEYHAPQPPPAMSGRSWLAWGIIAASVIAIGLVNFFSSQSAARQVVSAGIQLDFVCRYVVGAQSVLPNQQKQLGNPLAAQIRAAAKAPIDQLRIIPVIAELQGDSAAVDAIDRFLDSKPSESLAADARLFRKIYADTNGRLSPADQEGLIDRHEWFGRLAVSAHRLGSDPLRHEAISQARRTFFVFISSTILSVILLLAGFTLLIVGLVKLNTGSLRPRFHPAEASVADAMLMGFAVYLAMMGGLTVISRFISFSPNLAWQGLLVIPPIAAFLAVRLAGVSWKQMRRSLGLHRGQGIVREMLWGVVGYVSGLPLLAVAAIVFFILSKLSETTPTHPITRYLLDPGLTRVFILVLACVFAPIVEELMFRGMLLGHMRLRHSWILSAITVSFIFAAIHPQGWQAIPVLGAIAITLAGLREQRDCIVASMTAHALNNFMVMMLAIMAAG